MTKKKNKTMTRISVSEGADNTARKQAEETLFKAGWPRLAAVPSENFIRPGFAS